MIKAVLDTNVVISALFWTGVPHVVVEKGLKGCFVSVTSHEILKEVTEKLEEKFGFSDTDTRAYVEILLLNSEIVVPKEKLHVVHKDQTDNKIIECAVAGRVDYIVSGDKHLLDLKKYNRINIVAPVAFLKLL
jgi:uncharacterized protein